jgi:hypothetical protein
MARRPIYLKLVRMSPYTRCLTPPSEFLRRWGFDKDHEVEWTEQADGTVCLRFLKIEPPMRSPQPAMANG